MSAVLTSRTVRFYREPATDPLSPISDLTVDLLELSHAAAKETLQTGLHVGAWLNLFQETLTTDPELRWRDHGIGRGRELKRSFSNILGRFVARHYLESHEDVLDLVPIDGDNFELGSLIVRKRTGGTGDLPDWVGCTAGDLIIAEAKGSHDRRAWDTKAQHGVKKPAVIENAMEQVERVEIVRANGRSSAFEYKGWSVGSRWATKENNLEPWLMAIDPRQGDETLPEDEFETAKRAVFHRSNFLMLRTLGFTLDSAGTEAGSPISQPLAPDAIFAVRLADGQELAPSLHALAGPFGFLPLRNRRDFRIARIARRFAQKVALISLSEVRLAGDLESSKAVRRSDLSVERNGFAFSLLDPGSDLRIID